MLELGMATLATYLQIFLINIVLSGDNVVVIGLAAAGLQPELRSKAILAGVASATVIRIVFAVLATQLMHVTGLLLAGGLLLCWVCWKMYEELRGYGGDDAGVAAAPAKEKTLGQAIIQIVIADVSMSLDNVLAVAGASNQDIPALVFGLILSVVLMGFASSLIAKLLARHHWIAWAGLAIIVYVALQMVYRGADDLVGGTLPHLPLLSE